MKMMKVIKQILGIKEKEVPDYPKDFIIVEYSPIALRENILDEQNKIIYRYKYGKLKKYRYSEARLRALVETHNIPYYDKTTKEQRFPVWAKILPSEVEYSIQ